MKRRGGCNDQRHRGTGLDGVRGRDVFDAFAADCGVKKGRENGDGKATGKGKAVTRTGKAG